MRLLRRVRYAWRRSQFDADLAEEMAGHREMAAQALAERGVDPHGANLSARRAFGSSALAGDESRDVWVPRPLQGLGADVRLALRSLWSARLVAIAAIVSLGLGIGANTAMFSLLDALVMRPPPGRDPGRLVVFSEALPSLAAVPSKNRFTVFDELRHGPAILEGLAAYAEAPVTIANGTDASNTVALFVTGAFFDVVGVPVALGRPLSDADDPAVEGHGGAEPVAVVSYAFWLRHFNGAADAIGGAITIGDTRLTLIGVTPPEFLGIEVGRSFDIAIPLGAAPRLLGRADPRMPDVVTVMGRLRPGQSIDRATAALRAIQPQIREATMPADWPARFRSEYLRDPFTLVPASGVNWTLRRRYERPLIILLVVVALVLVVACGNVAHLLLARATARHRELGVRRALGASRWRLARQLLIECATIAVVASTAGLWIAAAATRLLVRQISTEFTPVALDLSPDARVLAFTVAVASAATLLVGIMPALHAVRVDPIDALKAGAATSPRHAGAGGGGSFIAGQVALSLVLVVTALLFSRSFTALRHRPLGFEPSGVLVVNMDARRTALSPPERVKAYERARDAARAVPGVAGAALSTNMPVFVDPSRPMLGQPIEQVSGGEPIPRSRWNSQLNLVSSGWFHTLGIRAIRGRDIRDEDSVGRPLVAVINQAFARKFLGGADPIGHTLKLALPGPPRPPVEIVGVVADSVYGSLRAPEPPTLYLPIAQMSDVAPAFIASTNLSIRTVAGSPALLIRDVNAAIAGVNSRFVLSFSTLQRQIDESITQERVLALVSSCFGGLALLLAGIGLYGVTAYAVSRRRAEIGIRLALGAAPASIATLVVSRVARLVMIGVFVGTVLSVWASRFVAALLYGFEPRDPATLAGAAAVLAAVAALAAWLPARRAARLDPAGLLRCE